MSAELTTTQGDLIKTAVESLKDFGYEGFIIFRPTGVELVGQDRSKVVDIRFVLPAALIKETGGSYKYKSEEPEIEIGILTRYVAVALKRFNNGDRVIIGVNKGCQRELYISCVGKGKTYTSEITTPKIDSKPISNVASMLKYPGSIVISSSMFHSVIGDLLTAESPIITFDCDGKSLKLSGEGVFSKSICEIREQRPDDEEEEDDVQLTAVFDKPLQHSWNVHDTYATQHLQRIAKAKNMAKKMILSIDQNVPASFEYQTPIGTMTYIVCARVVEDIDDPKLRAPESAEDAITSKKRHFALLEPKAEFDSDGEEPAAKLARFASADPDD